MIGPQDLIDLARSRPARRYPGWRWLPRAAVAAVVRAAPGGGAELLLIQRSEYEGDPWSGHMAMPGGRLEPRERFAWQGAERETREELGLDLCRAKRIGPLAQVLTKAPRRRLPMTVTPVLYHYDADELPQFELNHEVAAAVWVPFEYMADAANRESMRWDAGPVEVELPCYRYEGYLIWGLTLGIIDAMLAPVVQWRPTALKAIVGRARGRNKSTGPLRRR